MQLDATPPAINQSPNSLQSGSSSPSSPVPIPAKSFRYLKTIIAVILLIVLVVGAVLYFYDDHAKQKPQTRAPSSSVATKGACSISAILVNSCRPWVGAAALGNPGATNSRQTQFEYLEQLVGHSLDIYRDYHNPGLKGIDTLPLDANTSQGKAELYFAERPNTYIDINYKPSITWQQAMPVSQGGDPTVNAQIRQVANNVKGLAPHPVFLTVWWEPQDSIQSDPGPTNCCTEQGGCPDSGGNSQSAGHVGGTPDQYIAMWQNVENIFRQQGTTNVVWTMDYMSDPQSSYFCLVPQLWPGNDLVDWVVYDTYDHDNKSGTTFDGTAGRFYNLLSQDSSSTVDFDAKPWGLGEFGTCKNNDPANASQYYIDAKNDFEASKYPRLKMYLVYADTGNNSGDGCLTGYDANGNRDTPKQTDFE